MEAGFKSVLDKFRIIKEAEMVRSEVLSQSEAK